MAMNLNNVKKEVSMIMDSLMNEDRPIASPLQALKHAGRFPFYIFITTVCVVVLNYLTIIYSVNKSNWDITAYFEAFGIVISDGAWMTIAVTLGLGVFFILFFYPSALIYSSISDEVKKSSIILNSINNGLKRIAMVLWVFVVSIDVFSSVNGNYMLQFAGAAVIFISIFIYNIYLGTETLRYGLGPVVQLASNVIKPQKS